MLHPEHQILALQNSEEHSHRMMGWAVVGLVHVFLVWALVSGLAIKVAHQVEHRLAGDVILQPDKLPRMSAPPVRLVAPGPLTLDPKMPVVTVTPDPFGPQPPPGPGPGQTGTPDSGAAGLSATHTIPPYPLLAVRLGEHGKVLLHLNISPAGSVTAASITRSSGFDELDQSAVNWVIAHWKYRPATQNGAAVAGTADAAVVFDLKNAQ